MIADFMKQRAKWLSAVPTVIALAVVVFAALISYHASRNMQHPSLAARPVTRAYEGAPPVIPHPVRDWGRGKCLSCHDEGLRASAQEVAVPKPHPTLGDCVQCHVEQVTQAMWKRSAFVGWHPQPQRHRAYPGAPPIIPHRVWLRENCLACHGDRGYPEIRTTHPERVNCVQCHVEQRSVTLVKWNVFGGEGGETR